MSHVTYRRRKYIDLRLCEVDVDLCRMHIIVYCLFREQIPALYTGLCVYIMLLKTHFSLFFEATS